LIIDTEYAGLLSTIEYDCRDIEQVPNSSVI